MRVNSETLVYHHRLQHLYKHKKSDLAHLRLSQISRSVFITIFFLLSIPVSFLFLSFYLIRRINYFLFTM